MRQLVYHSCSTYLLPPRLLQRSPWHLPSDLCKFSRIPLPTFVLNLLKFPCTTLLLLHWLPISVPIQFKTPVLAHMAVKWTTPSYLQAVVGPYLLAQPLFSSTSERLSVSSLLIRICLCFGPTVLEWTPNWCQDSRVTAHISLETLFYSFHPLPQENVLKMLRSSSPPQHYLFGRAGLFPLISVIKLLFPFEFSCTPTTKPSGKLMPYNP